jgi:Ca-activated chloride channel homolog
MFLHSPALAYDCVSSNDPPLNRRRAHPIYLFLTLTLLLLAPMGQARAQDEEPADEVLRVRTDLITVPLFVTDGRGNRISGLGRQDFVVRDNGRVVETQYFSSGAERVALLFALDSSGSVRDIISQQRDTALALLSRFGKDSRVAVLRFSDTPELALPFTTRSEEALAAFNFPALRDRRTAIFDAAWEAVRAFDKRDATERGIIIIISDGLDTASTRKYSQVIGAAAARGVSFYVIHLPLFTPQDDRLVPRPAAKGFRDLAEKTGGKYFRLGDVKTALSPRPQYDLAPVFQAIEDDLRGQYLLGYYPAEEGRTSAPHRIEVSLANGNNRKLRVQALRQEYVLKEAR